MIVVDTGMLYATADRSDAHHRASANLLREADAPLVIPITVIVETSFLVERHLGPQAEGSFLSSLTTGGVTVDRLDDPDFNRMAELVVQYADLRLGAVDASVVAVAERVGATTLYTLDRRHFSIVRPRHVDHFTLAPDPRSTP